MEKIPTLFERDDKFKVIDSLRVGCEWVMRGEGAATEKLDGTNVRLTIRNGHLVRVEKRRNPNKKQKAKGIKDGWYVDASKDLPEDKWIIEAAEATNIDEWTDGEHPCEALGPKIQGNSLGLIDHCCVPFNIWVPIYADVGRSYSALRDMLQSLDSIYSPGNPAEGIVFHHPDGRRAKIKRKDFSY